MGSHPVTPVSDGLECANRVDSFFLPEYVYMTIVDHEKIFPAGPYFDFVDN